MARNDETKEKILEHINKEEIARAKVGIIALIDEATSYQNVRPNNDLRKIYKKLKGGKPV